jgi:hypothetical protein
MSPEVIFTIVGTMVSVGIFVGVTRTQTKTLGDDIKRLDSKVDKCVTKSDFPAFFAREKHITDHGGAK